MLTFQEQWDARRIQREAGRALRKDAIDVRDRGEAMRKEGLAIIHPISQLPRKERHTALRLLAAKADLLIAEGRKLIAYSDVLESQGCAMMADSDVNFFQAVVDVIGDSPIRKMGTSKNDMLVNNEFYIYDTAAAERRANKIWEAKKQTFDSVNNGDDHETCKLGDEKVRM